MGAIVDIAGKRYGRLLVVSREEGKWVCKCDCGNTTRVTGPNIRSGRQLSCGCLNQENRTHHGSSTRFERTPEYHSWRAMKSRCYRVNDVEYENYGGRGITVCDRWKDSFEKFLEDMGHKPSPKHTIDRIDGAKGYSPDNCRWSDGSNQIRNQRIRKDNKSGHKGVCWDKKYQKWAASIGGVKGKGKNTFLGYFDDLNDAIEARKQAEIKHWNATLA